MKRLTKWFAYAFGILVVALVVVPLSSAQGTGVLEGQVVNGTQGAAPVGEGLRVTLRIGSDEEEPTVVEATTDGDGGFRFEGLSTETTLEYYVEVAYLDVAYGNAEPYQFLAGQDRLTVTVTVYETTEDDSALVLESVHLIIESFGQVLRVSEVQVLGNMGDRTYIGRPDERAGDRRATVTVALPQNAVGLALDEAVPGERYAEIEGGLLDTAPVLPGSQTSSIFFSYHLVVGAEPVPLERIFPYPVGLVSVLVGQPGLSLRSEQLRDGGTMPFEDQQFGLYEMEGLAADTPLAMSLLPVSGGVGSSAAGTSEGGSAAASGGSQQVGGSQGLLRWLGLGLVGLALVGATVYATAHRRGAVQTELRAALARDSKARRLVGELADLEEALEAGRLDEAAYDHQRTEKVKSLDAMVR